MFEGILTSALSQTIFVFVLLFALVFGILQKSKILGEGNKQVNALVSLALALLVVSVGYALDLITKLVPVLAVGLVLVLMFLLFTALFFEKEYKADSWLRYVAMALAFIAVVVAILYYTNSFPAIGDWFSGSSSWAGNVVLIVIVIIVFLIAFFGKGDGK